MRFCSNEASECCAAYFAAYHASRIVTASELSAAAVRFSITESDCYYFGKGCELRGLLFSFAS